ncbi:MAG: PAS domain S-box protein [Proteobacteria bacterium]|nr:PAS domain S-box protein [Pseudomonadota bacterium]
MTQPQLPADASRPEKPAAAESPSAGASAPRGRVERSTQHGTRRIFRRFAALALGLNALLGLGLMAFDVADSVIATRRFLAQRGELLVAICQRMQAATPDRAPAATVAEAARLSGEAMALLNADGRVVYATDPGIAAALTRLWGAAPRRGTRTAIARELGALSGVWLIAPLAADRWVLVIVGHRPEDEGVLEYMTVSAGVLGLGLAITFWLMLWGADGLLHRPLRRLVGQLTGALARDVERRRRAEDQAVRARLAAERLLAFRNNLIEASDALAIVATDAEGVIRICNRAAERLLGWAAEELVGCMTLGELRAQLGRPPQQEVQLGPLIETSGNEELLVDKHGRQHVAVISRSAILDGAVAAGELWTFVDVTEAKRLAAELQLNELQLIQSAKMASLGEMATGVAHELNQPLNNIGLLAARMRRRLDTLPDDQRAFWRERLEHVVGQVERAGRIIDQLRSFGRRRERSLQQVSLALPVQHVSEMLRALFEGAGIALEVTLPPALPPVLADASQLEQVLLNLLINAVDACGNSVSPRPGGGRVRVAAHECQGEDGRAAVCLQVRDNGPGMAAAVSERVFQPFFTTKEPGKGTGLGLSISYSLVSGFGGTLTVDSAPGAGACFNITLPRAPGGDDDGPSEDPPGR